MKRILSLSLVLMMVLSLFAMAPLTVSAATVIGTGTEQDPYIINSETVSLYEGKSLTSGKHYRVEGAVTFNKPINYVYDGVFYGKDENAVITLNIKNHAGGYPEGLFQYASPSAGKTLEIKNLTLEGYVYTDLTNDGWGTGALVGRTASGTVKIENITNNATVSGLKDVGGLVGQVKTETIIDNCINTVSVEATSSSSVGGIAGNSSAALTIKNSKNTGEITAKDSYASGLVGYSSGSLTIENCANEGAVTGNSYVCGITRDAATAEKSVVISKTYNAGTINCTGNDQRYPSYGIIFSGHNNATVIDCYNVGDIFVTKNGVKTAGGYMFKGAKVTNFYNTKTADMNGANTTFTNTFHITGTTYTGTALVIESELKELTSTLGESFKKATPTKESAYPYPQIDGNPYVVAAASVPETLGTIGGAFSANEDISGTYADGDITYTGAYVAGFGIANDLFGWEKSYGMILEDANGIEYEADAVANSATQSGNYGVLFYGSKLVPGEYTLTPYVTYENYGETYQVKGDAITVTVGE